MFCATVLYPSKEGSSFKFEEYVRTLAPLYAEFLGENCVRFEVRRGLRTPGGSSPHFVCVASYWVTSGEQYAASPGDPRFKDVMAKFAAFTHIEPLRRFDEVVA